MEENQQTEQESAKEVAGKTIGKQGLFYITLIVIVGVGASIVLEESKMAAVMGLLGASLTALISMMNGIAGATPKQEKPEFEVIKTLISKMDNLFKPEQPMKVIVENDKIIVTKGEDTTVANRGKNV
jgi:hypothetical protein